MNNLLDAAADNIFISSANILDTLTYRISKTGTDISVPNNNDSLVAPLTGQLARDYDTFNQVLNDYGMDLNNCKYILTSMKIKAAKEKSLKEKREKERLEEEARLKIQKEKEELEKKEKLELQKKQLELQKQQQAQQQSMNVAPVVSATPNPATNISTASNNNLADDNDMILDLDLDDFNFDDAGNDVMKFNFDDSMPINLNGGSNNVEQNSNHNLDPAVNMNVNMNAPQGSTLNGTTAGSETNNSGDIDNNSGNNNGSEYLNFGQDSELADLNLDFLQDDDMGNLMQNMNKVTDSNDSKNDNLDDDPMATDQMEQLFSQFDEMVGNGI